MTAKRYYTSAELAQRDLIALETLKVLLQRETYDIKKLPEVRHLTATCYQIAGAMITSSKVYDDGTGE